MTDSDEHRATAPCTLTFHFGFLLIFLICQSSNSTRNHSAFLIHLITVITCYSTTNQSFQTQADPDWVITPGLLIHGVIYADATLHPFCYSIDPDSDSQIFICTSSNATCVAGAGRLCASLLLWSILIFHACEACSSDHQSTAINTLMKTLLLLLVQQQRQRSTRVWCITLSIGKRQAVREALMIEAMICQAFSRIYFPLSLIKPRCIDAYQARRNRIWEQGIATRCDQIKLCFVFFFCWWWILCLLTRASMHHRGRFSTAVCH